MRINNCHLDKSDFNSQLSISMKRGGGERGGFCFPFSQDELDFRMFVYVDEEFVNHKPKESKSMAESRISKRKPFGKWQHLSKSQMSTNMQCKV